MFSTFVLFPALGAILVWWHPLPLSHEIYSGFMYMTILPATGSVVHRADFAGRRQCCGSGVQRIGIQPVRRVYLTVAGQSADERAQQRSGWQS